MAIHFMSFVKWVNLAISFGVFIKQRFDPPTTHVDWLAEYNLFYEMQGQVCGTSVTPQLQSDYMYHLPGIC